MKRVPVAWSVILLATLAVTVLAGCGQFYWVKAESTDEQFTRDSQDCLRRATVSRAAAERVMESTYRDCLASRGYARQHLFSPGSDAHRGIEKFH